MSPEEKAAEIDSTLKDAKARKDADEREAGEKLDRVLSCLDSLGKRMDAFEEAEDGNDGEDGEDAKDFHQRNLRIEFHDQRLGIPPRRRCRR